MDRTVTVRGTGRLSLKPDTIEASINLNSRHKEYSEAMRLASARANALAEALLAMIEEAKRRCRRMKISSALSIFLSMPKRARRIPSL